ncbi:hypothetical protein J2Z19_000466 [Ensifer adhaerens]|uniref:Uncharacterized protein n=1 Tax=Ensifer adhaerens TaxID=106592 RepID=A0ACC5SPY8_ENSAD|nr:hypothetical protein [Ensifer adhaerens]
MLMAAPMSFAETGERGHTKPVMCDFVRLRAAAILELLSYGMDLGGFPWS